MKNFFNLISRLLIFCLASLLALSAQAHGFAVGELFVRHPYAAPTLAGVQNGAVYFKGIQNKGKSPDQLIGARAEVSRSVQMHKMRMDDKVMRMKELSAIDLPAGQEVVFARGQANSYHLMLLGLKQPLKDGDRFPVWLTFKQAGEVKVEVYVQAPKAADQTEEHKH